MLNLRDYKNLFGVLISTVLSQEFGDSLILRNLFISTKTEINFKQNWIKKRKTSYGQNIWILQWKTSKSCGPTKTRERSSQSVRVMLKSFDIIENKLETQILINTVISTFWYWNTNVTHCLHVSTYNERKNNNIRPRSEEITWK